MYHSIDIAKLLMAVFVVAIHTHPGISIGQNADFYITDVLTKIAVPYFFVTSGFS